MSLILRDYQEEAISLVMASWQEHSERLEKYLADVRFGLNPEPFVPGRELVVLGTGGGKTIIFSEIIRRVLAESRGLALILAHRDDLINQAIEKYHVASPDTIVGKVKGSQCDLGGEVTVASVASACKPKRLKMMQAFNYSIIVIDEAHHSSSKSYQTVLKAFPHAFVLLVTATEDRLDGKKIIEKPAIFNKDLEKLIREKYCAPARAYAIKTETNLDDIHTSMGDFNKEELAVAVNTPARNHHIANKYLEYAAGLPFIGFGVTIDHAEALTYTFNEMGIPCGCVTGNTSDQERADMYAAVASGSLQGMFSVQVLTEGFDLPCIACIIMARPTMSRSLYVQMIGRGSRLAEGKDCFIILDITDNCLKHRLTPHNLNKALNLKLQDGETIEEAEEREKEEKEKEAQVRRLKDKRKEDLVIDLLEKFDWQKRESDGAYIMTFGRAKHKIALRPERDTWNLWDIPEYSVWASLAPEYQIQKWSTVNMPLTEALQYAEVRVLKMQEDPKSKTLFDMNAGWRDKPVDLNSAQVQMAGWLKIAVTEDMTKGQLSALIDEAKRLKEQRKQTKLQKVKYPAKAFGE